MSALDTAVAGRSRLAPREASGRWGAGTLIALSAAACLIVDSLLTVDAQRVSLEADSLRKKIERVSMELGALESQWAAETAPAELAARAERMGLSFPEEDHIVILPASFLEEASPGEPSFPQKARREAFRLWLKFVPLRTP